MSRPGRQNGNRGKRADRYKLTSAIGDGPKTCAFFFSDKGCRNGVSCKFSHESSAATSPAAASACPPAPLSPPSVSSSSIVSSEAESNGEIVEDRAGAPTSSARDKVALCNGPQPPSACMQTSPACANPFLSPGAAPPAEASATEVVAEECQQRPSSEKKGKRRKNSQQSYGVATGEASFDLGKVETQFTAKVIVPPPAKKPKLLSVDTPPNKRERFPIEVHVPSPPNEVANFHNLQLPIASLSLPSSATAAQTNSPQRQRAHVLPPLPTATASHLKWKDAVIATRENPNYSSCFDYERAQQAELAAGISTLSDWITTRPYGPWCASNPASIAIDCEMCQTRDPGSGRVNDKALCRVSVVNAEDPSEVLLDTLVKPEWPVSDHRTWVNGIKASDLKNVHFTLKHAQTFMSALCSEQTLVVGHAVHNDLLAMRMVHHCNVDTAMLYRYSGEGSGTPSLKNLAHGVFGREMPDIHCSVNDARVALVCAQHFIDKNGKVDPVEKVFRRSHSSGNFRRGSSSRSSFGRGDSGRSNFIARDILLVHCLPPNTQPDHISAMFLAHTYVKPKNVPEIAFSGSRGKCHVAFSSREHADLAYATLVGEESEDKSGKKQKRVGLKGGRYVYVHKI